MCHCIHDLKSGMVIKVLKHFVALPKSFFLFRCYEFPPLNVGDQTCDEIKGKELQVRNWKCSFGFVIINHFQVSKIKNHLQIFLLI